MHIPDPPLDPARIAEFTANGYWLDTTSNDALEAWAHMAPQRLAIADGRMRLTFAEYFRRAERLAGHLIGLGLGADDVIALQLPNWSEFAIVVNAAMLAGHPVLPGAQRFPRPRDRVRAAATPAPRCSSARRVPPLRLLGNAATGCARRCPRLQPRDGGRRGRAGAVFDLRAMLDTRDGPAIR